MKKTISREEAVRELHVLFEEAGRKSQDLLDYVETIEFERNRLRDEVRQLKLSASKRRASSDAMNSRLKDALRE
ncbi:hypothetical protein M6D81_12605 [Paenibacillus sp. J5C_2022]|uniref:hypothetical protein n=1 Tax=Paenibacillus sp. J5C2022 TaxID=2977129 RepID=UPI0021CF4D4B|nr:hypothetical protein [Paenibacillus sp. J5C2022]MCU6709541.1 hypothetical protein [Paenibacillus sp. J5C2022]